MGAQSDVDRYRRAIETLQTKIASESKRAAAARAKEADARAQAARATSTSSATSRLRDAERRTKEASAAERRRASLERDLAGRQKQLHQAETKLDKERTADYARSLRRLEDRSRERERQFRGVAAELKPAQPIGGGPDETHDVFISHASEDKDQVARPLAELLVDRGFMVWYDEFSLSVGDSLRRNIDRGLASSRFGVIVLSPDFFRKEWPQAELDGLVAKQRTSGTKVILPIWHRLTMDDIVAASPTLADIKALNTSLMTMEQIADELAAVLKG